MDKKKNITTRRNILFEREVTSEHRNLIFFRVFDDEKKGGKRMKQTIRERIFQKQSENW
jgi:hypothetical protein